MVTFNTCHDCQLESADFGGDEVNFEKTGVIFNNSGNVNNVFDNRNYFGIADITFKNNEKKFATDVD